MPRLRNAEKDVVEAVEECRPESEHEISHCDAETDTIDTSIAMEIATVRFAHIGFIDCIPKMTHGTSRLAGQSTLVAGQHSFHASAEGFDEERDD